MFVARSGVGFAGSDLGVVDVISEFLCVFFVWCVDVFRLQCEESDLGVGDLRHFPLHRLLRRA